MSVVAQFSIFPIDKGQSLSTFVSKSVKIVMDSGLSFIVGPMGTSIEGEWEDVMKVINKCFESLKQESERIYMVMNIDYRKNKKNRIRGKVESIDEKLKEHFSKDLTDN